jgi:hypothetical protein
VRLRNLRRAARGRLLLRRVRGAGVQVVDPGRGRGPEAYARVPSVQVRAYRPAAVSPCRSASFTPASVDETGPLSPASVSRSRPRRNRHRARGPQG